jgi:hypothetical protein
MSAAAVLVIDETPSGEPLRRTELRLVSESLSVRELITARVHQEQPPDVAVQVAKACEAFERGTFLLFVGDQQLESLDDRFIVTPDLEVHFVRLVPLVGG